MNFEYNKEFDVIVNIKNNRIWLPKSIQKTIGKQFIEIRIGDICFITKLTKEGRFFIPKESRGNISNDPTKIQLSILKNLDRPKKFILNGKIDVLSFVPEKTLSGFDVLALEEGDKILLWYSTKGRPNEITINRFVPLEFVRLLGYYQAEGGKVKLRKRRGREINFTNADIGLIEDFLKYLKYLVSLNLCKCTIRYNPQIDYTKIIQVKGKLISLEIKKENIRDKQAKRIKGYTVKIWLTNSILGESLDNMMNKVREYLSKDKTNKNLIVYFLQCLIAGDGNFYSVRDKKGCLHSHLRVFEANLGFIKDYQQLFEKIGINGKIKKSKFKNYYIFDVSVNWNLLLLLLKFGLLEKSRDNHKRLIDTIKQHRGYKFGWLTKGKQVGFRWSKIV